MKWRVTGADSSTGQDRTIVIDAADEAGAIASGNYSGLLVERAERDVPPAVRGAPLAYRAVGSNDAAMNATPVPATRRLPRRPIAFVALFGIIVIAGVASGIFLSRRQSLPAKLTVVPPPPAPQRAGIGVSYDQIVARAGEGLVLEEPTKSMDGTVNYFGKTPGGAAAMLISGDKADPSYVHLAVYLDEQERLAIRQGQPNGLGETKAREIQQAMNRMRVFLSDTCPEWPGAMDWLLQNFLASNDDGFHVEYSTSRKHLSCSQNGDYLKVSLHPL